MKKIKLPLMIAAVLICTLTLFSERQGKQSGPGDDRDGNSSIEQGKNIFRHDTFGDQDFWGGTLQLHRAIEGAAHGGVGPGVSPVTALAVGLKVDQDALPPALVQQIKAGKVDLNDPAVTLALMKLNAVVGITGFFQS